MFTLLSHVFRSEGDPETLRSGPGSLGASDRMARSLGWFGIGLGLAELLAPHQVTGRLGVRGREGLVRLYGLREILSGILVLSTETRFGLWTRVAGDAIDIATLLGALRPGNRRGVEVTKALIGVLAITVADLTAASAVTVVRRRGGGDRDRYADRSGFPKGPPAVGSGRA